MFEDEEYEEYDNEENDLDEAFNQITEFFFEE